MEKAITVIERALCEFQAASGLLPRVILVPVELYQKYESERSVLDAVLGSEPPAEGENWTEIRVVEHDGIDALEVY